MSAGNPRMTRVAVLGAGANGSIIGAELARAGHDVTLVDQWPENVETIRESGLKVSLEGVTQTTRVPIYHFCEVAEMRRPFDVVLVVVKAYDTRWAVQLITPLLHESSVVVGVQNGMTAADIAGIVGPQRALGAVIEVTSAMDHPGVVERHSPPERCWFAVGALDPQAAHHIPVVANLLRAVGVVEETADIQSAKWMKLALNSAELVPSAIVGLSIADCARHSSMRELMLRAGDEALEVAVAAGLTIRPIFGMKGNEAEDPATYISTILDELTAHYVLPHSRSTVLQDWEKNRRSEVLEMNGEVVRLGLQHGVPTPVNEAIVAVARDIEQGVLRPGLENEQVLRDAVCSGGPRPSQTHGFGEAKA